MNNDQIVAYLLENERKRYEHAKEFQRTLRWIFVSLFCSITIIACCYMYYVVPASEESIESYGQSQIVMQSDISGENTQWDATK